MRMVGTPFDNSGVDLAGPGEPRSRALPAQTVMAFGCLVIAACDSLIASLWDRTINLRSTLTVAMGHRKL